MPSEFSEWEGRIVGGQTAVPGQFPYIVSIRNLNNFHFCGGTIISSRFVVSAAHCFESTTTARNTVIVVGAHHISNDGTKITLDRIVSHPDYNKLGQMENE